MMKKLFAEKVSEIVSHSKELSACHQQFENNISRLLEINELSAGEDWYTLTCEDFVKQSLSHVTISPSQKDAVETFFNAAAKEVMELKALIEEADKHINRMVNETMEEEANEAADMRKTLARMHKHRTGVLKGATVSDKKFKD